MVPYILTDKMNHFPSIAPKQMGLAGGTQTFTQPLMPNNVGGFTNITGFGGKYTFYRCKRR